MANPWFRMYVDFIDDPKIIGLAFEDQRHFVGILCLKSGGLLDSGAAPNMQDRIVAQRLWIDYAIVGDVKRRLMDAGLIDKNWQPVAWDRRQYKSDHDVTSAERQRRFREKQRNALHNGTVTPLDTDTDTEKTKPKRTSFAALDALSSSGVSDSVAKDWIAIRKSKRAAVTQTAINGIQREAAKAGLCLEDALRICCERGWAGFKAEWMRDEPQRQQTAADRRAATVAFLTGKMPQATLIEGEVRRVAG